jgi:hypothetical protein
MVGATFEASKGKGIDQMTGMKNVRLGLAGVLAAALVAGSAFLVVSQASAVSGTLSISSPAIAPGGQGVADLRSNVPTLGLGSWTVDITYDPTKISVVGCLPPQPHSVCNPNFASNKVRIAGASSSGLIGDTSLATITFHMLGATTSTCGSSPLTLSTSVFADATVGNPQNITLTATTNGTITCAAAATATPLPALVQSGTGPGSDNGFTYGWLIVGLVSAGLAALAGYGALRTRRKVA